ncbi:MAG TPA: DUF4954 family protein [Spirochaetia bacterium]|nr:DUF4954 family protein [Spirochaetaceae bacterium]HPE88801.1 DUF4954 family protein [Spirochaetales bacterium]HRW24892.1 DUF4954 family protein [Spirochaetia bacterium]
MNDILVHSEAVLGYGFVADKFLEVGESEYRLRNAQLDKPLDSYRPLRHLDVEILIKNGNRCSDWGKLLVREPFDATLIRNSEFAGLVRIGSLERVVLEHHDMMIPAGITNSRIISCDIGDQCAVHSCIYLAHYIVGDRCILMNNDEMHVSDHAKWGNGIIKEGETEDVRVRLDLMNEAGGRSVLPFDGMLCADAYLWAKRREDAALMERFEEMTDAAFEHRRGEYGVIGSGSVLKSNRIIKDVRVGECAYIKGANKLKNLTINSSEAERTQIGEGVELVNGIIGYGCRVFYGCKAVRFVMGTNSALKYGARLIHSVLGDNSTVSCCEMLNNLIFPAHEQHHNTSFLIASLVRGQSNMAAGATIGSNHNSRANDGEIDAGRGFWPGLSTSVKHSSRFASYCLLAKGAYRFELDVPFPFALVADDAARDRLEIMPAYWWMYNMYALLRNESKFVARDKRQSRGQNIEFSPFAPDIAEEAFNALGLLERFVGTAWYRASGGAEAVVEGSDDEAARAKGRELLLGPKEDVDALEVLGYGIENSRRRVLIQKPRRAYKAYRHLLRWYAMRVLIAYFAERPDATFQDAGDVLSGERVREWENLGGQLVPRAKVEALVADVKDGKVGGWGEIHAEYARLWAEYPLDKAQHAWATLCDLLGVVDLEEAAFAKEVTRFMDTTRFVEEQVYLTRRKDYVNGFRLATFRGEGEMRAVLGTPESASFVRQSRAEMERWRARADALLGRLSAE